MRSSRAIHLRPGTYATAHVKIRTPLMHVGTEWVLMIPLLRGRDEFAMNRLIFLDMMILQFSAPRSVEYPTPCAEPINQTGGVLTLPHAYHRWSFPTTTGRKRRTPLIARVHQIGERFSPDPVDRTFCALPKLYGLRFHGPKGGLWT